MKLAIEVVIFILSAKCQKLRTIKGRNDKISAYIYGGAAVAIVNMQKTTSHRPKSNLNTQFGADLYSI